MIESIDYSAYLSSLVSIAILLVAFHQHKTYRLGCYRQRLFHLRNDLFDKAAKGDISFDSQSYGMTRELLNSHIRFAHRTTFFHTLLYLKLSMDISKLRKASFHDQLEKSMKELSEKERALLETVVHKLHYLYVDQVIRYSLVLRALVLPVFMLFVIGDLLMLLGRAIRGIGKSILNIRSLAIKQITFSASSMLFGLAVVYRIIFAPLKLANIQLSRFVTSKFEGSVDRIDEAALAS